MFVGICNLFVGICNPGALTIRIFNPQIALKMLTLNAGGLQIHLSHITHLPPLMSIYSAASVYKIMV